MMTRTELKMLRTQHGLTQSALAELLGVHWNTVARYEQGALTIPEPMARLMALVLKTSPKKKKGRR
jgi:DNA-binding transcriptional regulator YiaG